MPPTKKKRQMEPSPPPEFEPRKVLEDPGSGLTFEYLRLAEAEILFEEIVVNRCYAQHGIEVQPNSVVVDAGANIGLFALWCALEAPGLRLACFEPLPPCVDVLSRNVNGLVGGIGGCSAVAVVPFALGACAESGESFTYYPTQPGESTRYPEERLATLTRVAEAARHAFARAEAEVRGGAQFLSGSTWEGKESAPAVLAALRDVDTQAQRELAVALAGTGRGDAGSGIEEKGGGDNVENSGRASTSREIVAVLDEAPLIFPCRVVTLSWALAQLEAEGPGSEWCQKSVRHKVSGSSLEQVPAQLPAFEVDLLKIDVEGSELSVLHGITDVDWNRIRQVVVEVCDSPSGDGEAVKKKRLDKISEQSGCSRESTGEAKTTSTNTTVMTECCGVQERVSTSRVGQVVSLLKEKGFCVVADQQGCSNTKHSGETDPSPEGGDHHNSESKSKPFEAHSFLHFTPAQACLWYVYARRLAVASS